MDSIKKILNRMFAQKLQKRRKEMGFYTQKDLAEKLKIEESRISRWERGRFLPGPKYWNNLVKALKFTEEYFIGDTEPPKTAQELGRMLDDKDKEISQLKSQIDAVKNANPLAYELAKHKDVSEAILAILTGTQSSSREGRDAVAKLIKLFSRLESDAD